jgi:hypothetical protein
MKKLFICAVGLFLSGGLAQAATWDWANVDGNWTNTASWTQGTLPSDSGSGTADRINLNRDGKTLTVNSPVNAGGPEDYIIHNYGTLDVATGGVLNVGYLRQQSPGSMPVLRLSGGTVNFLSTSGDYVRFGNAAGSTITSRIDIVSGTLTAPNRMIVSYGSPTYFTQSGGTFNSTAQDLALANSAGSLFDATVSGGTFKVDEWVASGGATDAINFTIDGSGQDLVIWRNMVSTAGNAIALNFKLDSGWDTTRGQLAITGSLNLANAGSATVNVDFGSTRPAVGEVIVLASGTAYGQSGTASITTNNIVFTSLTSGFTFDNVSDATALKIRVTSNGKKLGLYVVH